MCCITHYTTVVFFWAMLVGTLPNIWFVFVHVVFCSLLNCCYLSSRQEKNGFSVLSFPKSLDASLFNLNEKYDIFARIEDFSSMKCSNIRSLIHLFHFVYCSHCNPWMAKHMSHFDDTFKWDINRLIYKNVWRIF